MLDKVLQDFKSLFHLSPGDVPLSCRFGSQGPHLVVTGVIHGNEVGPLPGILRLLQEIQTEKKTFSGSLSFALGNLPAALEQKRFLEVDMNRIFDVKAPQLEEEVRAQQLSKLIRSADLYLDFHQTIEASKRPFYVMANHPESVLWARALRGVDDFVFQSTQEEFVPGALCSDEYAQRLGIPALSIECWQKGFRQDAADLAYSIMDQAIRLRLVKAFSLENLSALTSPSDLKSWKIKYRHRDWKQGDQLKPGLVNLEEVKKGQPLGQKADGSPLVCPDDGLLLFPKYFENQPQGGTIKDSLFVLAASEPA